MAVECEPLMLDMLRSMEDIERALESAGSVNSELKSGLEMILADMKGTMEKYGVTVIPSVGCGFDPGQHECVMQIEASSPDENDGNMAWATDTDSRSRCCVVAARSRVAVAAGSPGANRGGQTKAVRPT